ncbi:hypothetical protein GCM10028805_57090 [Spirosoma harenae]
MNASLDLEQLITEGIKGLPQQYLSEVADFVLFIRRRALQQQPYDLQEIRQELHLLDAHERQHLEDEFKDFDQQFPKE